MYEKYAWFFQVKLQASVNKGLKVNYSVLLVLSNLPLWERVSNRLWEALGKTALIVQQLCIWILKLLSLCPQHVMGLWATWSIWRCPCSLKDNYSRWPLMVPSNSENSMVLWWSYDSMTLYYLSGDTLHQLLQWWGPLNLQTALKMLNMKRLPFFFFMIFSFQFWHRCCLC